ncbi:MAG: oligosaccharide flippase family protein [Dehalococcoidia bacterium]
MQALAQGVILVSSVALATITGPSAYGGYASFLAVSAVVAAVSTLRHDVLISSAKDEREALAVLGAHRRTLLLTTTTGLALASLMAMVGFSTVSDGAAAVLSAVGSTFVAILSAFSLLKGRSGLAAVPRLFFGVTILPLQMLFLSAHLQGAIVWGHVLSQTLAAIVALFIFRRLRTDFSPPVAGYQAEFGRNLYVAAGLVNTLANNFPIPIISAVLGDTWAGYFALSNRILGAPLLLLGNSVSTALMPEFARSRASSSRVYAASVALGLCFALLMLLVHYCRIVEFLAPDWAGAVPVLITFVPVFATRLAAIPSVAAVAVARDGKFLLGWEFFRLGALAAGATIFASLPPIQWLRLLAAVWSFAYATLLVRGYLLLLRDHPPGHSAGS